MISPKNVNLDKNKLKNLIKRILIKNFNKEILIKNFNKEI